MKCFGSMASISIAFATHGPGMMPEGEVANLEAQYLQYRVAYNSFLGPIKPQDSFCLFLLFAAPGYVQVCLVKFGSHHKNIKLYPC